MKGMQEKHQLSQTMTWNVELSQMKKNATRNYKAEREKLKDSSEPAIAIEGTFL